MREYRWAILYGVVAIGILYLIEHQWMCNYLIKTGIKIPLFTLVPWFMTRFFFKTDKWTIFKLKNIKAIVGGVLMVVIGLVLAYLMVNSFIDVEEIRSDLSQRMAIPTSMMIFVVIYTTFINAFIEEFFFRGFLFLGLLNSADDRWAYILSSGLFAIYHVTIFMTWFSLPLMLVAIVGLFIGGLIFAWFAHKSEALIGSWLVHMAADATIMVIAFLFLGL